MPLYEYRCRNCNHEFEQVVSISNRYGPTEAVCTKCNLPEVELVISTPAVISPFALDGLKKPSIEFKQRMAEIKQNVGNSSTVKDY
jgi:putative FmdB family regulatory protein